MSSELLHECESCGAVIHAHEDLFESQTGEVYCKKCATVAIEEGEKGWTPYMGYRGERSDEQGDEAHAYLLERDELAARVEELEATLEKIHRLTERTVQPEDDPAVKGGWPVGEERLRMIGGLSR